MNLEHSSTMEQHEPFILLQLALVSHSGILQERWQDTRQAGSPEHVGTESDINHPLHPKAINNLASKEEERRLHRKQDTTR